MNCKVCGKELTNVDPSEIWVFNGNVYCEKCLEYDLQWISLLHLAQAIGAQNV